ncbi:hypothetical protein Ancab_040016 [Ancistrocladus abbreviatus]
MIAMGAVTLVRARGLTHCHPRLTLLQRNLSLSMKKKKRYHLIEKEDARNVKMIPPTQLPKEGKGQGQSQGCITCTTICL